MPEDPNKPTKPDSGLREYAKAESVLQMALGIPAGAFVGLGIGYLLDRHFHTKWLTVTLLLLGAAGGFFQFFTYISRTTKRGDE